MWLNMADTVLYVYISFTAPIFILNQTNIFYSHEVGFKPVYMFFYMKTLYNSDPSFPVAQQLKQHGISRSWVQFPAKATTDYKK